MGGFDVERRPVVVMIQQLLLGGGCAVQATVALTTHDLHTLGRVCIT